MQLLMKVNCIEDGATGKKLHSYGGTITNVGDVYHTVIFSQKPSPQTLAQV